jgi:opacity protein-like surface antigen
MFAILSVVMIPILAAPAAAEIVYLKDGSRLTGQMTAADSEGITLQTPDGSLLIKRSRIDHIDYDNPAAATLGREIPPVEAEERVRRNELSFSLGPAYPLSANQFNQIAGAGTVVSFTYLREVDPLFALGLDYSGMAFGQKTLVASPGLTSNTLATAGALSLIGQITPWPDGSLVPFGVLGIGLGSYTEKVNTTPNPGYVWGDTGTTETRTTLDASSSGFALQAGIGVQRNFTKAFFTAVEADWHYISIDKNVFGASSIEAVTIEGRLGWRY